MASTPKGNETKEIIGMRVKGIEDYRDDFDDHSYSGSSIAESYEHSMRLSQQGLIRNSFQVLLPLASPATSVKLPLQSTLPLKDNFNLNSSEDMIDYDEDFMFEHKMDGDQSSDTAATAEQLLIFEALIQEQVSARGKKEESQKKLPPKPKSLHSQQYSLLELDEDDESSHTKDSSSTEDGEDSSTTEGGDDSDDDDSDDSTSDRSSSWGCSEESAEGGITYFAALTTKRANPNATTFALTPFESVVDDATKSLKIKYDQIIYPTGSKFHSRDLLDTQDYHRLQNIQFVKWIKSNNEMKTEPNEQKAIETDEQQEQKTDEQTHRVVGVGIQMNDIFVWLKKSINLVYTYYRGKDRNDLQFCYHLIDSSIFQHFEGDGYKIMLSMDDRENYELFKLFELLLHTLGRLCSKLHSKSAVYKFYEYLELTKKIFPSFKVHLDLLKQTFKAHQDKKNANHCIQSFVQIYYNNQYAERDRDNELASFELCVKALVALDLYMENYSPLNHSILSDKAAYDINSESFKWLDAAYNKYHHNKYHMDEEEEYVEAEDDAHVHHDSLHVLKLELCSNPQSRMDKLAAKYEEFVGFSLLRARCSWVIGHSMLYHQRQFYESEEYFFEALYCLKTLQNLNNLEGEFFPLNGTMQTELASLVLIDYADVLLENKKYQYAINALECVIDCLNTRGSRKQHQRQFQIIRKLCMICTEKEDWNRAIKYHDVTLAKLKDNYLNLNEFVYLSQQISTIHLKLNNFAQSEKELQEGIKHIYLNVLSQYHHGYVQLEGGDLTHLSIDEIFEHCEGEERISIGSLLLMLANLYISGGNYLPAAIHILNYLKKYIFNKNLAEARLLTIYFQLARAYFKNGRYSIADDIIQKEILARYSFSKNKDLLSSLEFVQLRILIMIHCKRFEDALRLLDDAMTTMIKKESFVKRAKINYLKGRVLQWRCFNKLIEKYEEEEKESAATTQDQPQSQQQQQQQQQSPSLFAASRTIHDQQSLPNAKKRLTNASSAGSGRAQHRRQHVQHVGGNGDIGDLYNGMSLINSLTTTDYAEEDINPLDAITSLLLSHSDYKEIDPIMQAKCCLELSKTYLEIMMEYYALPHFVLQDTARSKAIMAWLGQKIFNDVTTPMEEVIIHCLDEIYHPLHTALSLSTSQTKDIGLLIESYIALAEFEFLKANLTKKKSEINLHQTSKNFWKQSKITLFGTYRDSDDWIFLRRIDRHSRLQIFDLFKRILRLLICFDNKFIADNVQIFVSYGALETFMIAQRDIIIDFDINNHPNTRGNGSDAELITRSPELQFDEVNINKFSSESVNETESEKKSNNYNYKNPTVTFRICDGESEILSQLASAANVPAHPSHVHHIRPLVQRFINFNKSNNGKKSAAERDLDELFRMHWKMRSDANMFSGGRLTDIDNDKSLAQITKCIAALNCGVDRELNINETSPFQHNETFIISLDSIVFMFHPHTLSKYAIHKVTKRNEMCRYEEELQLFSRKLARIAFHDSDFLDLADNPWIKQEYKDDIKLEEEAAEEVEEEKKEKKEDKEAHNQRIRNKLKQKSFKNIKKKSSLLSEEKQSLLRNELCLPYLKLESVSELLMCLDPQNILALFGAVFSECPIIIVSKERCRCLAIIDALFVLMYPFSWQYPMIPWLSPYCAELLKLAPHPYIVGVANIQSFSPNDIQNRYTRVQQDAVIIDADTNNVIKPRDRDHDDDDDDDDRMKNNNFNPLPLKLKSKLTRAMFRLMSGLLKNEFQNNTKNESVATNWVFPPRRRDNMRHDNRNDHSRDSRHNNSQKNVMKNDAKYNLLTSPQTAPISICSERKTWYKQRIRIRNENNKTDDNNMRQMIINFQKEFCTAWVEVLEQYRLFWVNINEAMHDNIKVKSEKRIQKYAHPRYRKFLTEIQKTRMFSSFQCIRSLANNEMLSTPMFDNLVMRSLRFRQSLYHEIIRQQKQERGRMKVSVINNKKRHFINHHCSVRFDPSDCTLYIKPDGNNLSPFEVILKATIYELVNCQHESRINVHNKTKPQNHPYIDRKQVQQFGDRYQFKIVHNHDGILTCNCQNYYQLTRWIHILRTHSMDTWSFQLNRI